MCNNFLIEALMHRAMQPLGFDVSHPTYGKFLAFYDAPPFPHFHVFLTGTANRVNTANTANTTNSANTAKPADPLKFIKTIQT